MLKDKQHFATVSLVYDQKQGKEDNSQMMLMFTSTRKAITCSLNDPSGVSEEPEAFHECTHVLVPTPQVYLNRGKCLKYPTKAIHIFNV